MVVVFTRLHVSLSRLSRKFERIHSLGIPCRTPISRCRSRSVSVLRPQRVSGVPADAGCERRRLVRLASLGDGFAWLGSPAAMLMLGVAAVLEVGAYFIPGVGQSA